MKGYTIQHSIDLLEKAVENGGGSGGVTTAADVSYDNTSSHLTADDVQEAIDELNTAIESITVSADDVSYDNTDSGLTASDVQAAIDELKSDIDNVETLDIYSETETVVGKWIDDSDVYQKVISAGALPNATAKDVAHGITNLSRVISVNGISKNTTTGKSVTVPTIQIDAITYQVSIVVDSTNITLTTGSGADLSSYNETYIIIRYLKTAPTRTRKNK